MSLYIYYCSILKDNLNVFSVSVTLSAFSSYIYLISVQSFKIQIYREDGNSSVSGHHNPQSPRFKFCGGRTRVQKITSLPGLQLQKIDMGTNLVLGPPEKFYRRNPSGTFRDVYWYHLDNPKKVPGAPSQGFLIF